MGAGEAWALAIALPRIVTPMIPVRIFPAVAHPRSPATAGEGAIAARNAAVAAIATSFFIASTSSPSVLSAGNNPASRRKVSPFCRYDEAPVADIQEDGYSAEMMRINTPFW